MTLNSPKEKPLPPYSPPSQTLADFFSALKCVKLFTALNKANQPGS